MILKNLKTLIVSEDQKGLLLNSTILAKELARLNIKCNKFNLYIAFYWSNGKACTNLTSHMVT